MYNKKQLAQASDYFQVEEYRIKELIKIAKKYSKTKLNATEANSKKVIQALINSAIDQKEALFLGIIYWQLLDE